MEIFGFYFNWVLIVSSILALIGIILMLISFFKYEYFVPGIIIVIVALVIGFGLIASVAPVATSQYEVNAYEVAFTSTSVTLVIIDNDYTEVFYDVKTYNILKNRENCQVYYVIKLNSYNIEIETPQLVIDKRYE